MPYVDREAGPGRPRRRWFRRILLVLGAFLVLGAVLAAVWVRYGLEPWLLDRLERDLSERLGGEVRIAGLSVELAPLGLRLRDVRVSVPADAGRPLTASLATGEVRIAYRSLLPLGSGRIHLTELRLDEPSLDVSHAFLEGRKGFTRRRDGPLDVRIDRFVLRSGRVIYENREIPLEFIATNVNLEASWARQLRAMIGTIDFESTVRQRPFVEPLAVSLSSSFRWRGERVELHETSIAAPGVELHGEWVLEFEDGASLSGKSRASADLVGLRPRLDPDLPAMSGLVEGTLEFQAGPDPLRVSGEVEGRAMLLAPLRAEWVAARIDYQSSRLELRELRSRAYGGRLDGSVIYETAEPRAFRTDLTGSGLSLHSLLELIGVPLPLDGGTELRLELEGDPEDRTSWEGGGTASVAKRRGGTEWIPTSGSAEFAIVPGTLKANAQAMATGATGLDVGLEMQLDPDDPGGVLDLRGETGSAAATLAEVLRILEALEIEPPDLLDEPLTGRGAFRSRIAFGEPVGFDLDLSLRDGSWAGQSFDAATLDLAVAGDRLEIRRIVAHAEDRGLEGSVVLDLAAGTLLSVDIAEARNVPLQPVIAWLLDSPPELGGSFSGNAKLAHGPAGLAGGGWLEVRDITWLGERINKLRATFEATRDVLVLSGVELTGPALGAGGSGRFDLNTGTGSVEILDGKVRIEDLELVSGSGLAATGEARVAGTIEIGELGLAGGELKVACEDPRLDGRGPGPTEGTLALGPERIDVDLSGLEGTGWSVDGWLGLSDAQPFEALFEMDGMILELTPPGAASVWSRLTGDVTVSGSISELAEARADAHLDQAELHVGAKTVRARDAFTAGLADGVLSAGPLFAGGESWEVELRGTMRLDDGSVDASLRGQVDLGLAAALLPDVRAAGMAAVDVEVGGSWEAPKPRGVIRVKDGQVRLLGVPHSLQAIEAILRFEGDRARIESFRGLLGGGEVRADGEGSFHQHVVSYRIGISGSNVQIKYPEGFRGVYDAKLELVGENGSNTLTGKIDMLRGLYKTQFDLAQLVGLGVREYEATLPPELPERFVLDIDVLAKDHVWLRNDMAEIESSFGIHLGGELARPEVTGRLQFFEGGKLRFRDVDYRIVSGSLIFSDPERINPYLTLRAETRVKSYDVLLRVDGTLDRFDYQLTSMPVLSQQDIIALLTTGRTLQELTTRAAGDKGDLAGDLAANYFAGALTDRFEKQLQRLLGLERFEIDPLLASEQADPTARITLGKEVADDLFVIASTELGASERQIYQVEWQASRRFGLTAERGATGGVGGDFRYSGRFWLGKSPTLQEPAVPLDLAPDVSRGGDIQSRIDTIAIEGVPDDERRALLKKIHLTPGEPFRRGVMFEGAESIRRYYARQARIQAAVESRADPVPGNPSKIAVRYDVETGPATQIDFRGVERKEEKRLRVILEDYWVESIIGEDLFVEAAQLVRDYFKARGFYTADVQIEQRLDDDPRGIVFAVDRGKPVRIREVRIEGAEGVSEERIRRQVLTRRGTIFSRRDLEPRVLEEDVVAIRNMYRDEGFLEARVLDPQIRLSAGGDSAVVTVRVMEGPQFVVQRVDVPDSLSFDADELRSWSTLKEKDVFSPARLLQAESSIRKELDDRGYSKAQVRGRAELDEDSAVVRFQIEPGEMGRVGVVEISGNHATKARVIRGKLLFEEGDLLSREKMLQSQHRLYQLGVFRSVRIDAEPMSEQDPVVRRVRVQVEEDKPLAFTLGAGFDDEAGPRGSFSVVHQNLGGWDRTLSLQGRLSAIERRIQLTGTEPGLLGERIPILASLLWESREEVGFTADRRAVAVRLDKKFGPKWTGFTRYNFQRVDLTDVEDALAVAQEKLENIQLGDLGFAVVRDTRDDPFLTTRGNYASLTFRLFHRAFLSKESFVKTQFQNSLTVPVGRGHTFAWAVRMGLADPTGATGEVPLSERFFAGGDSTLRGFSRDTVGPTTDPSLDPTMAPLPEGGEGMLLLNQEWRFPIWRRLRGVVFYDAGNVWSKIGDIDPIDLRHVLGMGLRFETPIGPIRLEYGRKLDREEGEPSGELFLAIGTAF